MWQMRLISCLHPTAPCSGKDFPVWGREGQRIYGFSGRMHLGTSELRFARRTSCLKHPPRHHFQHFPSIATNPRSLETMTTVSQLPTLRILTRLVWRGRLIWRRLPFLKAPLRLCLQGFSPVWGLRTTALCTSSWFKSTCFLLVSDPLALYVSMLLTTISLNISSAEPRASQAARLFKNLVLTSSVEDQMH